MSPRFEDTHLGQLRKIIGTRLVLAPGARILLERDDGKVLLERRADFNNWGLPAGHAEPHEDIRDTIVREAQEEIGITPINPRPYAFSTDPKSQIVTYPNGDQIHAFSMNFYATEWQGEPRPDMVETLEVRWFATDDLPDNMNEGFRRAVAGYVRFKKTGEFQML